MMIELRDINKTYNNGAPLHVLKGINLDMMRHRNRQAERAADTTPQRKPGGRAP